MEVCFDTSRGGQRSKSVLNSVCEEQVRKSLEFFISLLEKYEKLISALAPQGFTNGTQSGF